MLEALHFLLANANSLARLVVVRENRTGVDRAPVFAPKRGQRIVQKLEASVACFDHTSRITSGQLNSANLAPIVKV